MLYTFKIKGKIEKSESPVIFSVGYAEGFFIGRKLWMHHWDKGVTQCSELLTMEEIGQLCGGN
jgi:hypothetical protein